MTILRRVVLVTVALLIAAPAGLVSAAPAVPAAERAAQDARTPGAICEQATQDLAEPESREFEAADDVLQDGVDYWAVICTSKGPIYLDLLEQESPMTVNNFVFLAQNNYFNNTTFHRVLPGFMAQGGDPTGTGGGGPGYEFGDETGHQRQPVLHHLRAHFLAGRRPHDLRARVPGTGRGRVVAPARSGADARL